MSGAPSKTVPTPYRQLSRLQSAYHLELFDAVHRTGINDVPRGLVLVAVARACVGDWTAGGVLAPPDVPRAGTTVQSLADSLRLPFETTRRHVQALLGQGVLVRGGGRLSLGSLDGHGDRAVHLFEGMHDSFLRLVGRLVRFGIELPRKREDAPHPLGGILRYAIDQNLEPVDNFRGTGWDLNTMALWMAVSSLEVEHVTHDPVLSRRYAVEYTPDELRRPVSLRNAACRLSVPYASAWRRALELERLGLMRRADGGWLISKAQLTDERIRDAMMLHGEHMLRRVRSAIAEGLDPNLSEDRMFASSEARDAPRPPIQSP